MKRITLLISLTLLMANSVLITGQRRRLATRRTPVATPCDKLASHADDRERRAKGVTDADLDALAVIAACEPEVQREPSSGRLAFQLARGYLKAGRVEDAIEQLVDAGNQGHGGALAYLGDLYLDGAAGLNADPVTAHALYQRAAKAGFAPAKAVLANFEDVTEKVASLDAEGNGQSTSNGINPNTRFINPEIVDNVLKGDLDAVPYGELYTKLYLANMAENISGICEAHFTKREVEQLKLDAALKTVDMSPSAGAVTVLNILQNFVRMRDNPGQFIAQQAEAAIDQEHLPEEAMKDAFALISRHSCGSRALSQFSKNLVSYIRDEDAPRLSTDQLFSVCQREARPTGRYNAANFCMCFTSAMPQTAVSRANRKGLSSNFWPTAVKMMEAKPAQFEMCSR